MSITAAILICLAPIATDGDTLNCGPARVRLYGVNAPETGQPGASAAKAALQSASTGGLICEPRGASYSRIVAICSNAKGVDVGQAMLVARHVLESCVYSRNYYGSCP